MSYNLYTGGHESISYHEKQLRFILKSHADMIGFRESGPAFGKHISVGTHADRLAKALGWHHWTSNYSIAIASRYPIVQKHGQLVNWSGGVRVNLNGEAKDPRELHAWNTHPHSVPYGPQAFCSNGSTAAEVLEREAVSGRTSQIKALITRMEEQLNRSVENRVVLVDDMKAPSHLDWTPALSDKDCGIPSVRWPTSSLPTEAGLIDSFRAARSGPVEEQGLT